MKKNSITFMNSLKLYSITCASKYFHIYFYIFVEDCTWSSWTVGTCTKTCGGGQRLKNRTLLITEGFGGKCSGHSLSSESCNTNNCPGVYKIEIIIRTFIA